MSGGGDPAGAPELLELTEPVVVRPVADWREALRGFDPGSACWGFASTASRVMLGRHPAERWREVLQRPRLIEARLFDEARDLHWLEGRGVVLEVAGSSAGDGYGQSPSVGRIDGAAWLQRDRRSRLWGEWLEGTDTWYEERIPDPIRYPGIEPEAANRYVFLRYREYVREGRVEYVRYRSVEGAMK